MTFSTNINSSNSSSQSQGYSLISSKDLDYNNTPVPQDFKTNILEEELKVCEENLKTTHLEVKQVSSSKNPTCLAIAKYVLEAYPLEDQKTIGDVVEEGANEEGESSEEGFDPEKFYQFFTQEILSPQEHTRKKTTYNILASAEMLEQSSWQKKFIINEQVWGDLNLLFGNREHPTTFLGEILTTKRTYSEIGKAYFNGLLARPIDDVRLLQGRQAVVQHFATNEGLFKDLCVTLEDFAKDEPMLTGMWGKEQLMQFIKQEEYFTATTKVKGWPKLSKALNLITNKLNRNAFALEVKTTLDKVNGLYGLGISHLSPIMLLLYGSLTLTHLMNPPEKVVGYTDSWMTSSLLSPSMGIIFALPYLLKTRATQGLSSTSAGLVGALKIQRTWKQFLVNFKYDDFLRKRLGRAVQCLKIMQKLEKLIPEELTQHFQFYKHFKRIFHDLPLVNAELADVMKNIQSPTFDVEQEENASTSYFFRRGKVLCVYRLLDRIKALFEPAIAAVGEIDAYLTIAKLIKETTSSGVKYCYPTYVTGVDKPSIELHSFWNNFLDPNTVVKNTVFLGSKYGIPHMVVTGPNSGGKSTIVCKGIPLAIIMAQSLGIAPAQSMTLTPFSHIAVYMNIADSLVNKESRFQREGKQAFAHGDYIKSLSEQNAFSLAIFDEIFSGTSPEEGAKWGYLTAAGFAKYSNCLCVIATHFPKLTQLEKDTQGHFVNFKVSIEEESEGKFKKDEKGKLKRTYTLERGISNQHIAQEVLQEQGETSPFFIQNFLNQKV